jgi:hypothetical protein
MEIPSVKTQESILLRCFKADAQEKRKNPL